MVGNQTFMNGFSSCWVWSSSSQPRSLTFRRAAVWPTSNAPFPRSNISCTPAHAIFPKYNFRDATSVLLWSPRQVGLWCGTVCTLTNWPSLYGAHAADTRLMNDMHHSGLKYRLHYHRLFIVRWFTRHSKDNAQYNNTQIESLRGSLIHHACIFSLSLWAWINMTLGPTQEQSKKGRTTFKPNTKKDLSGGFQHLYVAQLGRNILGKIRLLLCLPVPPAPPRSYLFC